MLVFLELVDTATKKYAIIFEIYSSQKIFGIFIFVLPSQTFSRIIYVHIYQQKTFLMPYNYDYLI